MTSTSGEKYPDRVIYRSSSETRLLVDRRSFGNAGKATHYKRIADKSGADLPRKIVWKEQLGLILEH
jgi:hypothetical protein